MKKKKKELVPGTVPKQHTATNLSAVDEPVFSGQPVRLSVVAAGHAHGELVDVVRGGVVVRANGRDRRQQKRHGRSAYRIETATGVRRHRRAVCYWWRSRRGRRAGISRGVVVVVVVVRPSWVARASHAGWVPIRRCLVQSGVCPEG